MTAAAETDTPRFISLSQRVGRLRYFAYTLFAMVALGSGLILVYLLALLLPPSMERLVSSVAFILVKNIAIPMVVFVMSIRRLHDINARGWWSLIILFPFTTLFLLAIPGTPGPNRFGAPLPPNGNALRIWSALIPCAILMLYVHLARNPPPPEPTTEGGLRSYRQSP
ncbi:MAG: DUF805 domain-containing protein [Proteobacteria bacterium]|nr:DUF805 domain-containing protein [Pseudomonadota bacterium]HQR03489.1 DUF805 domain-containing protein [Rhodocyclaceae bacterium]